MKFATFCSGIGAPEAAWSALGWQPLFVSEIEPFPCAVLAHHYPSVPNLGDMEAISAEALSQLKPDVVCAGTPCQSFSVAGLRKGMADPRGNLALVFLRLIDWLRPRWVVWENVPGVLSSTSGEPAGTPPDRVGVGRGEQVVDEIEYDETSDFLCFITALSELGYGCAYRTLDAQYSGVPQRRRRVFVVGHLGNWQRAAAVLFERHSLSGHPAPSREAGQRIAASLTRGAESRGRGGYAGRRREDDTNIVAGTISARTRGGGGLGTDFECGGGLVAGAVSSKWAKGSGGPAGDECYNLVACSLRGQGQSAHDHTLETYVCHSLRADGFGASEDGTGRGTPLVPIQFDTTQITSRANYSRPIAGQPCHPIAAKAHAPAIAFNTRQDPIRGAMADPLGTKDTGHGIMLGMAVRRLTPLECERLQGFSDGWTAISYCSKPAADGPRYRAIGNSIAIPILRWIGKRIAMVDAVPEREAGAA